MPRDYTHDEHMSVIIIKQLATYFIHLANSNVSSLRITIDRYHKRQNFERENSLCSYIWKTIENLQKPQVSSLKSLVLFTIFNTAMQVIHIVTTILQLLYIAIASYIATYMIQDSYIAIVIKLSIANRIGKLVLTYLLCNKYVAQLSHLVLAML